MDIHLRKFSSLYTINLYMLAKSEFLVNLWKDILNKPNTAKDNATRKSFFNATNVIMSLALCL